MAELTVDPEAGGSFGRLVNVLESSTVPVQTRLGDLWPLLSETARHPLPGSGDDRSLSVRADDTGWATGIPAVSVEEIPVRFAEMVEPEPGYVSSLGADYSAQADALDRYLSRYPTLSNRAAFAAGGQPIGLQLGGDGTCSVNFRWPDEAVTKYPSPDALGSCSRSSEPRRLAGLPVARRRRPPRPSDAGVVGGALQAFNAGPVRAGGMGGDDERQHEHGRGAHRASTWGGDVSGAGVALPRLSRPRRPACSRACVNRRRNRQRKDARLAAGACPLMPGRNPSVGPGRDGVSCLSGRGMSGEPRAGSMRGVAPGEDGEQGCAGRSDAVFSRSARCCATPSLTVVASAMAQWSP